MFYQENTSRSESVSANLHAFIKLKKKDCRILLVLHLNAFISLLFLNKIYYLDDNMNKFIDVI